MTTYLKKNVQCTKKEIQLKVFIVQIVRFLEVPKISTFYLVQPKQLNFDAVLNISYLLSIKLVMTLSGMQYFPFTKEKEGGCRRVKLLVLNTQIVNRRIFPTQVYLT